MAVRLWEPEIGNVVTQVAEPEVSVWAPQLVIVVPAFLKLTVPVGVTPPPETVAVRVVEPPTVVGLGEATSEVVDVPALTVSVSVPVEAV
jgi:hypothetical protein